MCQHVCVCVYMLMGVCILVDIVEAHSWVDNTMIRDS